MLSERDRRALDEIERHIAADDPRFAAAMRLTRPTPTDRWVRRAYDAIIVLGALTAALCFVLLLVCAGTLAVIAVGAAYYLRPTRLPPN